MQSENQKKADAEGTAAFQHTSLADKLGSYIPKWQADDSPGVHGIPPSEVGLDAKGIYYGRCANNYFYVFVLNYPSSNYNGFLYVPDRSPATCKPPGLQIFLEPQSIGEDWYAFTTYNIPENIITPTPSVTPPATATPNPTALQATINAAVQQQVATESAKPEAAITQTIAAAVQATLNAARTPSPTP